MCMRAIVNISLPAEMNREMQKAVKQYHFASKSEFVRALMREWMQNKLLQDLKKSRAQYGAGKGKKIKSATELWS